MRRNDHHPSDHADSNPSIHFVTIKTGAKKRNKPEAVWGLFFAVTASVARGDAAGWLLGDGRAAGCRRIEWQGIDEGRAVISRAEPPWMNVSL